MKAYPQNKVKSWLWFAAFLLLLGSSGCSNTRRLADNQSLLVRNALVIEEEDKLLDKNELKNELKKLARQQPNKRFLGFWRLRLSVYNFATRKDDNYLQLDAVETEGKGKFRQWIQTRIGEPPVVFDSTLMKSSQIRMRQHLFNNGYFNAKVSSDYEVKKKKARVNYYIDPNDFYTIDKLEFAAEDSVLGAIVARERPNTLVLPGDRYAARQLDQERTRLTDAIQNEGYFAFNRNYIIIEVDTFKEGLEADVYYRIKNPQDQDIHKKYYLGNIFFDLSVPTRQARRIDFSEIDTAQIRNVTTYLPPKVLDPKPIVRSIFFNEDSLYRKSDYNSTLRRLNSLDIFRSVNVSFDPYHTSMEEGVLDAYVSGTLRKKQTISIQNEWNTDTKSSLGIELATSYVNRNIFKHADRLEFSLRGGLELQLKREQETADQSRVNTVELHTILRFKFPELTIPYMRKRKALPVENKQNSSISLSYDFERRLGFYTINNAGISWEHDWYSGPRIRHILSVPSLTLVAPNNNSFSEAFLETLETYPTLKRSFEPQFIAALAEYAFIYSGHYNRKRHYLFYRGSGKTAGNLLHGLASIANRGNEKPYTILGIDYSQFLRLESDFRYYINTRNGQNTLATRFLAGVGIPYGNVDALPFTEQFYGGGNQSLRGWRYRGVGPGGFDTRGISGLPDQVGDVRLEFNAEFRFTIYKFVKAALFMDAGNVWLLRRDPDREDAEFRFSRSDGKMNSFIDEFALNMGFGVRLDFNFFVVRFDAGLPLRDPAFDDGDRWQFDKIDLSKGSDYRERIGLFIAIGYPF